MIPASVNTILFDYGGVLIDINYTKTIKAFENMGIERFDELYAQAAQTALFDDYEIGAISSQRFINGLLNYLPKGINPNQVVAAWNAMLLGVPKKSIELLNSLKCKYDLFMLSNTNDIHIHKANQLWNSTSPGTSPHDYFEKVYYSFEIGMRKPHKETFEAVLKLMGKKPAEVLFIDDSIQHIEGAKSAGIHTHHLQSIHDLESVFS